MDMQAVAHAMVTLLAPVLPMGIAVREADHVIVVTGAERGPGAGWGEEVVLVDQLYHLGLDSAEEPRERLINACRVILERVQECVAEATAIPWPGEKSMPEPHVTIRDGSLICRYGSINDPVLVLPPVPLHALGVGDVD